MNKVIFGSVIFVAGVGVGYALGWYLTKSQYESYVVGELEEFEVPAPKEPVEKKEYKAPISYTEQMNRRKEALLNTNRVSYDTFSKTESTSIESNEDDSQKVVDEEMLIHNNDNPDDVIFAITPDQFAYEERNYDKVTLYWWELNRILTDDELDILDVPDLIGLGFEQHIGKYEKDMVYIRNRSLETDYEVCVKHDNLYSIRE